MKPLSCDPARVKRLSERLIISHDESALVAKNQWHSLRVEFSGRRIQVAFDGKVYIEVDDDHIVGPGAVGVWTKADSVTAFDDFSYGPATKP